MMVSDNVRTGNGQLARYGIEPFDVGYGASYAAEADSPFDIECEVIEDGGTLQIHLPKSEGCVPRGSRSSMEPCAPMRG